LIRIKWEGLYVALSRVKFKDDVRLLLRNGDRSTMAYIQDLQKNTMVKCFFNGYVSHDTSEQYANSQGLLKWDCTKAAREAGFI
jgi:hypothetical protein